MSVKEDRTIAELAKELLELWQHNEKTMGEMAAYSVACEEMGISEEKGWDMLHRSSSVDLK